MRLIVLIVSLTILIIFMVFYLQMSQQVFKNSGSTQNQSGVKQTLDKAKTSTINYNQVLKNAQEKTDDVLKNK